METLLAAAALALAGAVAVGFLGDLHPAFDSVAHFRAHLAALALLAALPLLLTPRTRLAGTMAAAVALLGAWTVMPYVLPLQGTPLAAERTLSLLQMNVLARSEKTAAMRTVLAHDPDFVTLQEVIDRDLPPEVIERYPHRVVCITTGGMGLLSRHPFAGEPSCMEGIGFVLARVRVEGRTLTVASQHLRWPWPFAQHRDIDALAPTLRAIEAPAIIAGDFNAAPWSASVRRYATLAGLNVTPGIGGTWPGAYGGDATPRLGVAIDHVLTAGVTVTDARTLAPTASDHLPVLVRFQPQRDRAGDAQ